MSGNRPAPRPAAPGVRPNDGRMIGLRYLLPVVIVLGGVIVMAFGSDVDLEGGAGIVSAGLAVFGMNWLYRASIEGDRVREEEEAARVYLDVHGHWPDETATVRAARPSSEARVNPGAGASSKARVTPRTGSGSTGLEADVHRGARPRTS